MEHLVERGIEKFRNSPDRYSYMTPYGYQIGSCGYCKDPTTSAAYYGGTSRLTPAHYQSLLDLGWRRSGTTMYLPDPIRSCCPHYTVRIPVADFKPTRDQRQAVYRWNRHVLGDKYGQEAAKVRPKTREEKKREKSKGFDLVHSIHDAETSLLPPDPKPQHEYCVTLEPDTFTEEKYQLFAQYQREIHREAPSQISRKGFEGFLCASPLVRSCRTVTTANTQNTTNQHLGSYHQTHRFNGKLIAMSVLDLLPHAVSAVYFIYDVSFSQFSLGKVSALHEAALALEGGHEYYYMGYYIHGCAKMRYKNDYRPQYFLDWESKRWEPLDDGALDILDGCKFYSPARRWREEQGEAAEVLKYGSVREAEEADTNIYRLQMPGLVPLVELIVDAPPENTLASVKGPEEQSMVVPVTMLVGWELGEEDETETVKRGKPMDDSLEQRYQMYSHGLVAVITELCAAVGTDVAKELVVDLGGGVVD